MASPELRRLRISKVGESGERAEGILSDAMAEDAVEEAFDHDVDLQDLLPSLRPSFSLPLPLEVLFNDPFVDRKKDRPASEDDTELCVERELRDDACWLSIELASDLAPFLFPFRALCSPTNSRSGSVQITSHITDLGRADRRPTDSDLWLAEEKVSSDLFWHATMSSDRILVRGGSEVTTVVPFLAADVGSGGDFAEVPNQGPKIDPVSTAMRKQAVCLIRSSGWLFPGSK